jgi:hypothetical protein
LRGPNECRSKLFSWRPGLHCAVRAPTFDELAQRGAEHIDDLEEDGPDIAVVVPVLRSGAEDEPVAFPDCRRGPDAAQLSAAVHGDAPMPRQAPLRVRAMPMRQLHITAGNSPLIPVISAVRGLGVKGAVTLKMPSGALAAGGALAVAMHFAGPEHPLTRHGSVVYWQGGDRRMEDRLFTSETFDRIVVWGAPAAVDSVRARAGLTKTLTFNPRYGASMIGAEALLPDAFEHTVRRAATDTLVWNQKACIASLVH